MASVQESVEVRADAQRAYEMWTEAEHYPDFIPYVQEVRRTGETVMEWMIEYGVTRRSFRTQIVQTDPEAKIAIQTTESPIHILATVAFDPTDGGTRITLTVESDYPLNSEARDVMSRALNRFKEISDQGPPTKWPSLGSSEAVPR
jgi:ribosome-associated toxin RatA of RatAB toxin-antitoxin module